MKLCLNKKFLSLFLVGILLVAVAAVTQQGQADSLSSTSVTLSNPRLSFRGALDSNNTVGSSIIYLNTTADAYPSTSSAQLVQGDSLSIGEAGSLGDYEVASTSSLSTLSLTSALASDDADAGDDVISSQSATHTVRLTTANAIPNGSFRILVPALADNGASSDGIPDGGKFDFDTTTPTVTCPDNTTATYDFTGGDSAAASSVTIDGEDYHAFSCAYTGTGAVGTAFDNSSNDAITIAGLINPAPDSDHHTGVADTHNIIVQHLDNSSDVIDATSVGIGVIEAVKVTASVPSQINFKINGVASGTTACGTATDVQTTATAVQFGEIPLDTFTDAAQELVVSTNAVGGYSVTATANDQLGRNGATCTGDPTAAGTPTCIPDSSGDASSMSHTAFDGWDAATAKGFAYSLDDYNDSISNGSAEAFSYDQGSGNCSGASYCARQFADAESGENVQEIFGSDTVADNEHLYSCYRVIPSNITAAGNYENYVTYTATATF